MTIKTLHQIIGHKAHLRLTHNEISMMSYFREKPWRAAEFILGIKLSAFQKLILYMMFKKNFILYILTRGGGKSFILAVYAVVRAALWPNKKIGIISGSFRQAKTVYFNILKFYRDSSVFRDCFEKKPVIQQDICTCLLKNGSIIDALPLGDGSKIRGARFYDILIDEYAQIPIEILDVVVLGMGATTDNPVRNADIMKVIKRLKLENKPYKHLSEQLATNKVIGTSTAFYRFNHLWDTMVDYHKIITDEIQSDEYWKYGMIKMPFTVLPDGFMDMGILNMARKKMSSQLYDMEYRCLFPSDSDGFFKLSILNKCFVVRRMFEEEEMSSYEDGIPRLVGKLDKNYTLAIDPARTSDDCGFVLIEEGFCPGRDLIANVKYINNRKYKAAAELIWWYFRNFNITRIFIDPDGGGMAIKDILNDPEYVKAATSVDGLKRELIWDIQDPESYFDGERLLRNKRTIKKNKMFSQPKPGRHVLKMVKFVPRWLSESNHTLLNGFENESLLFPRKLDSSDLKNISSSDAEKLEDQEDNILKLQTQIGLIVLTQTKTGIPHWDTPKAKQRKDLYSALLIGYFETIQARDDIKSIFNEVEEEPSGGWVDDIAGNHGNSINNKEFTFTDPRDKFVIDNFSTELPSKKNNRKKVESEEFYADLFTTP